MMYDYDRPKLNEVMPGGVLGMGIFSALQSLGVPWQSEYISTSLDIEYYGNISGDKYISPLIDKLLVDGVLSQQSVTAIARMIYDLNNRNWVKLWNTLNLSYDPIQNYDMTERMTDDETVIDYGKTKNNTRTATDQRTDSATDTNTPNLQTSTNDSVFGFNSNNAVPSAERDETATGTNTTTHTGSDNLTHNDTDAEINGGTDTQTRNYLLTRSGNIGVTTSQQMIQSERDLWVWNFFYTVVYPAIDRVLTIQIY